MRSETIWVGVRMDDAVVQIGEGIRLQVEDPSLVRAPPLGLSEKRSEKWLE